MTRLDRPPPPVAGHIHIPRPVLQDTEVDHGFRRPVVVTRLDRPPPPVAGHIHIPRLVLQDTELDHGFRRPVVVTRLDRPPPPVAGHIHIPRPVLQDTEVDHGFRRPVVVTRLDRPPPPVAGHIHIPRLVLQDTEVEHGFRRHRRDPTRPPAPTSGAHPIPRPVLQDTEVDHGVRGGVGVVRCQRINQRQAGVRRALGGELLLCQRHQRLSVVPQHDSELRVQPFRVARPRLDIEERSERHEQVARACLDQPSNQRGPAHRVVAQPTVFAARRRGHDRRRCHRFDVKRSDERDLLKVFPARRDPRPIDHRPRRCNAVQRLPARALERGLKRVLVLLNQKTNGREELRELSGLGLIDRGQDLRRPAALSGGKLPTQLYPVVLERRAQLRGAKTVIVLRHGQRVAVHGNGDAHVRQGRDRLDLAERDRMSVLLKVVEQHDNWAVPAERLRGRSDEFAQPQRHVTARLGRNDQGARMGPDDRLQRAACLAGLRVAHHDHGGRARHRLVGRTVKLCIDVALDICGDLPIGDIGTLLREPVSEDGRRIGRSEPAPSGHQPLSVGQHNLGLGAFDRAALGELEEPGDRDQHHRHRERPPQRQRRQLVGHQVDRDAQQHTADHEPYQELQRRVSRWLRTLHPDPLDAGRTRRSVAERALQPPHFGGCACTSSALVPQARMPTARLRGGSAYRTPSSRTRQVLDGLGRE